jgi:2-C-methyl-D-erythritol 2,4-cyclodiphosphate synthase
LERYDALNTKNQITFKSMNFRIGYGYDVHRLAEGETLWLGGVLIPHTKGTVAHSDGDVLIHALCDAMLGAAKMGDIGRHFPDTSADFKNIDSKILLAKTNELIATKNYRVGNLDVTVAAQRPKLKPFIPEMEETLSRILNIDIDAVSIKATTTEELGFEGREEGISVHAVVLLEKFN